ncbi:hypothetical protein HYU21_00745 [Candidatus Woesearchaeota archaeon]|nr:hypothetical protein [Candidatus Woesearchaeota archaeon]
MIPPNKNITYRTINKEKLLVCLKNYLAGALVYGLGIALCRYLPYYKKLLRPETQLTLLCIYFIFLLLSPAYYLYQIFTPKSSEINLQKSKPCLAIRGIKKLLNEEKIEFEEKKEIKTAILFLLVKIFFLPLMVNFAFSNFQQLQALLSSGNYRLLKNWFSYPVLLILLFTIDTIIFAFAYGLESSFLKNTVRSVEPTLLGWAVALICYPPFNTEVGKYVPWGANDNVFFWNQTLTTTFHLLLLILLLIYVSASIALGTKASNLTNRGIVSKFPYSIIRHPAYISKCTLWWLTLLPVLNWKFFLGMSFWTVIYYLRAYTEEKHLSQDSEYIAYKEKVKWKFIPGLI